MNTDFITIDGFLIKEKGYKQTYNKMYEGLMTQGNGYMHLRASFEEGLQDAPQNEQYERTMKSVTTEIQRHKLSKQGTYIPLIMGKNPYLEEVIINLPYFIGIAIVADSERLDMIHSSIKNYSRTLNMKTGELTRSLVFCCKSGALLKLTFKRFASMNCKHLFVQKLEIEVLAGNPKIEIISSIDADVTTNGYDHFIKRDFDTKDNTLQCQVTTDLNFEVYTACKHRINCASDLAYDESNNKISVRYQFDAKEQKKYSFEKLTAISCSRDLQKGSMQQSNNIINQAEQSSYDQLLEYSKKGWGELWESADIIIEGDDMLQNGYRFSAYHLMRCNTGKDSRVQVCAKGFAGEAYYGRYFWDNEIFLLPFYIYTNPKAAKQMINYRYHTLNGARKNAKRYGCHGARYPWQSALTGEEQCCLWEYADNEIHITADVAFAVMHYFFATNDMEFMVECGLEILIETSRFWMDRADTDENGVSHLINVMGPDEYSPMTLDNGFTNRLVKYNLNSAVKMYQVVKSQNPANCTEIEKKLDFNENELADFTKLASSLTIPYDHKRDLYLQSADFETYAPIDLDQFWKDRTKAFGYFVPQEKIYRTRCIKQADTIAMMSLFPNDFTDHQTQIAYDYYMPLTTHDSSLSPAGHTMIANRIGRFEDVKKFIKLTLSVDLSLKKLGAEDGIHIANCGYLWQLIVNEFMGIAPAYCSNSLTISPKLPKNIQKITAKVNFKNVPYTVTVDQYGYKINKDSINT